MKPKVPGILHLALAASLFTGAPTHGAPPGPVDLAAFIDSYEARTGGRVYEVEREIAGGRAVYDIESSRGAAVYETRIDAASGKLLSEQKEDTSLWTPISEPQRKALFEARRRLGLALRADRRITSGLVIAEIGIRSGGNGLVYIVTPRGSPAFTIPAN